MSDFLTNLALRSLGAAENIQPRLPALFEPPRPIGSLTTGPGMDPPAGDQALLEEIVLQGDAQTTPTRNLIADTIFNESDVRTAEERRSQLSSTLRPAPGVTASDAAPPRSSRGRMEEFAPETVQEPSGTASRTVGLRTGTLPSISSARYTAELQSNGGDGLTIRPGRMTTDSARTEPLSRDTDRLPTTATETRHRLANIEPILPRAQGYSHGLTAATRAEARPSSADHSPPVARLIAPSGVVPRDAIFAPTAPTPRPDSSEPTIQVTIGRIEVRAMSQPAPTPRVRSASRVMPLDEYLRQRSRRGGE